MSIEEYYHYTHEYPHYSAGAYELPRDSHVRLAVTGGLDSLTAFDAVTDNDALVIGSFSTVSASTAEPDLVALFKPIAARMQAAINYRRTSTKRRQKRRSSRRGGEEEEPLIVPDELVPDDHADTPDITLQDGLLAPENSQEDATLDMFLA